MQSEDEDGNTALITAIWRNDLSTASVILSLKSGLLSIGKKNLAGDAALWIALENAAKFGEGSATSILQLVVESLPKALDLLLNDVDAQSWIDPEFQITFKMDGRFGADQNTLFHRAVLVFPDEFLVKIVPIMVRLRVISLTVLLG